ncbi:hypothetical protein DH2020_046816 [Rehmannia glutinosa]|uniref:Uncharacterized protein n=1 Tax=Rehmannia glutinosa TaxID=99300 RepID=A0ABR0UBU1_REHGL
MALLPSKGVVISVPALVLSVTAAAVLLLVLVSTLSSSPPCTCPTPPKANSIIRSKERISTSAEDIEWVKSQIEANGLHMQQNVLRKGINPRTRQQQLRISFSSKAYRTMKEKKEITTPLFLAQIQGITIAWRDELSLMAAIKLRTSIASLIYASAVFLHMPDKLVWIGLERLAGRLKPFEGRIFVSHNIKFCSRLGGEECTKRLNNLGLEYRGKHTHDSLLFNHYEIWFEFSRVKA